MKLRLKFTGQEVAPSGVQPHLEETALVVDDQVLTVSQVLHNVCRDYSDRREDEMRDSED